MFILRIKHIYKNVEQNAEFAVVFLFLVTDKSGSCKYIYFF